MQHLDRVAAYFARGQRLSGLSPGLAILDFTDFKLPATVVNGTSINVGRTYLGTHSPGADGA